LIAADLIAALDSGQLSHAALDALKPELLPPELDFLFRNRLISDT
jgi:phosphoglycerate dehydrogenase-like enzyme